MLGVSDSRSVTDNKGELSLKEGSRKDTTTTVPRRSGRKRAAGEGGGSARAQAHHRLFKQATSKAPFCSFFFLVFHFL